MQSITHFILAYGYVAVFLIILLEDFGIPVPGETALVAAGILAGTGHFNIVLILILAFLGAVIGDNIGYAIGHFGGRRLVLAYGKYVFIREKQIAAVERFFEKHGNGVIVISRFISGARQLNGIIAGIGRMHWLHFLTFNILGAALWVGAWGMAAYLLGKQSRNMLAAARHLEILVLAAVIVAAVAYGLYYHFRRSSKG